MPAPIPPFVAAGMAVPGIPSWILWKISVSELPCRLFARVRSGPRPPPLAPSPWQNAQFERNWYSPRFATLASPAYGFFSCAYSTPPDARRANSAPHPETITERVRRHESLLRPVFLLCMDIVLLPPPFDRRLRTERFSTFILMKIGSLQIYHSFVQEGCA